jgi:hypothetical protein
MNTTLGITLSLALIGSVVPSNAFAAKVSEKRSVIVHAQRKGTKEFMVAVGERESSNKLTAVNQYGMLGKYQFAPATLRAMNVKVSKERFLHNERLQDSVMRAYMRDNLVQLLPKYRKYLGKKVHGVTITISGLLAGAHLVGFGGICSFFGNPKCAKYPTKDGNGTPIQEYMTKFGGYTIDISRNR